AKELVKAFESGDKRALDRIRWNHPRFRGLSVDEIKAREFALADAQLVIARTHHIESWPKLLQHVRSMEKNADPTITRFEDAADAIIEGNLELLKTMLREHPDLIRQRSTRAHHSTLLHYISANGVEDYRQITPPNIVEITRFLIDAGAEVDAESNAYGGGSTTLGLTATSAHPRIAGVQLALIDLLVERGAVIGAVDANDGGMVRACLANGCPEAAMHLIRKGAKLDNLYGAAVLGRQDIVQQLFANATARQRETALLVAAQCEQLSVVEYLLENGVDVAASNGMTALHWAGANGDLPMINLLLAHNAPLEAMNEFGGTVLSSTIWFAYHARPTDFASRNYPATFDRLIAAGGRTDFYPEMQHDIDGVYNNAKRT
ncbi:MAG: ankyrin repeat domain-containing protein, partial [Gemmatimonadaceae bacterium]